MGWSIVTSDQACAEPKMADRRAPGEIHSRMKACVRVLETACFTVPDSTGWFQIADVPMGVHTVKAWHPGKGEQTRSVTVAESEALHISFDF